MSVIDVALFPDRGGDCTIQPTFNGFLTYI